MQREPIVCLNSNSWSNHSCRRLHQGMKYPHGRDSRKGLPVSRLIGADSRVLCVREADTHPGDLNPAGRAYDFRAFDDFELSHQRICAGELATSLPARHRAVNAYHCMRCICVVSCPPCIGDIAPVENKDARILGWRKNERSENHAL